MSEIRVMDTDDAYEDFIDHLKAYGTVNELIEKLDLDTGGQLDGMFQEYCEKEGIICE